MLGGFLAVNLDRADPREVFLDQVAQRSQGLLLAPLLAHHPPAKQAHHHQHQGVEAHRRQAQPGIDRQHGWQGEGVGQGRVGEAEHGEAKQAPHVFHITGGPADHFTAAGGLHPARFLPEHVIKNLLLQVGFHLATHAEHELTGQQSHTPHHRRQHQDQTRLMEQAAEGKAVVQVVDHLPHLERNGHAEHIHHHQGQGPQQHGFFVGP